MIILIILKLLAIVTCQSVTFKFASVPDAPSAQATMNPESNAPLSTESICTPGIYIGTFEIAGKNEIS